MKTLSLRIVAAGMLALVSLSAIAAEKTVAIAVPDLSYKQQVSNFFYFESASFKSRVNDKANFKGSETEGRYSDSVSASGSASHIDNSEGSYVKTYGDTVKIEYSQLRGMTVKIRDILLHNGYRIVDAPPMVAKTQDDSFFDITKRIKVGTFGKADYVLYGVVSDMDYNDSAASIPGTNAQMYIHEMNMNVDFTLIDTKTLSHVLAFNVSTSGNDNKLGDPKLKPSGAKIAAMMSDDLAGQVGGKLAESGFVKGVAIDVAASAENPIVQPAPAVVQVYRPDDD